MFAPLNSDELGLAYGNRSALSFQMNNPHLALKDIKLALKCPHSDKLKQKLLDREKKSNHIMLQKENVLVMKNQTQSIGTKYLEENVLRLKTPSRSIPNAEEFVSVNYTKERGRRLVVNKTVPAGK